MLRSQHLPRGFLRFLRHKSNVSSLAPTIKEILKSPQNSNSNITARGHIKSIRSFKNIGFIDLTDGSINTPLNVVFHDPDEVFDQHKLKIGQALVVQGNWAASQGKQGFELQFDHLDPNHRLEISGDVPESYPIQKKHQTLQYLRNLPVLRHRTGTLASILRFRSKLELAAVKFFEGNDFVKVSPPLITSSDCEGAGEMFKVEPMKHETKKTGDLENPQNPDKESGFFGKDAYLTVSTQLHLEVLALSLNRVWSLSPCFRAEDLNTNRHLSEFWMLEAEICYVEEVSQLTKFVEEMIRGVVLSLQRGENGRVSETFTDLILSRYSKEEQEKIQQRWTSILSEKPWPSITYTEALELINKIKNKGRLKGRLTWGDLILTEHEKWLAGEHFQGPLFITDYPKSQKPFYMPPSKNFNPEFPTVACFDLVVPEIGELVGGSVREHNHRRLLAEMQERNMAVDSMEWYLSTRANGSVPHGGFGMGFERLIAYLGAMENLKDVTAFPRAPQICQC